MFIQMVKNLFFNFLIFFSINSYCLVLTEYENFYETDGAYVIETLKKIDVVICTALIPGKKAPLIINEKMINNMQSGSVIYLSLIHI